MLEAQLGSHPLNHLEACTNIGEILDWRRAAEKVRVSEVMRRYMVDLAAATRSAPGVRLGASPRASLALMKCSQALAMFDGMEFVTPEHVQEIAVPVLAHRLLLDPQAQFSGQNGQTLVREVVGRVPVPA
jgi:MoxR-like ATPase